jgi:hypothetical protein
MTLGACVEFIPAIYLRNDLKSRLLLHRQYVLIIYAFLALRLKVCQRGNKMLPSTEPELCF